MSTGTPDRAATDAVTTAPVATGTVATGTVATGTVARSAGAEDAEGTRAGGTDTGRRGGGADGTVWLRRDTGTPWLRVCSGERLRAGRGVAVLLPDGGQAAVFRDRAGTLYAIDNVDPFTGAAVLSRGLLGAGPSGPYVASPLLKQRFDLTTGRCLDEETAGVEGGVRVRTYETRAGAAYARAPEE